MLHGRNAVFYGILWWPIIYDFQEILLFNVVHVVAYTLTLPLSFVAWNWSFINMKQLIVQLTCYIYITRDIY